MTITLHLKSLNQYVASYHKEVSTTAPQECVSNITLEKLDARQSVP